MFRLRNLITIVLVAFLLPLGNLDALAGETYQRCRPSTDCIIGEYVFDNTGSPITSQICTIDITNPSGSLIVDGAAMTAHVNNDGWHYYTANIASPEGFYRALMYCDNSGDTGYLDKSFILGTSFEDVATTSDISSAVTSIKTIDNWNLGDIITYVSGISSNIGTPSDTSTEDTLFGKIAEVKQVLDSLTTIDSNIDSLVSKWGSYSATDIYDKVKNLSSEISAVNAISNVSSILTLSQTSASDLTELKNKVLAMKAVVDVNRALLEKTSNAPIIKSWLEEGSIIFKTMIVNPSKLVSQTVPLRYFLPRELKREDIIEVDQGLSVDYDASEAALFVYGEFELEPEETKTVFVETADVWRISYEQIESLRRQAEDLAKPLAGTSYYAQGASLVSDINASLDRAIEYQKNRETPQAKIRAFREASIEFESAIRKVDDLKTVVASAGSAGTMFGFVGGVQTVVSIGLVMVFIAGFVFLALGIRHIFFKKQARV